MKSQASEVSSSLSNTASGAENIAPSARQSGVPPSVPDHQLLRSIGVGSYGEVWLARSAIGSLRAVKVVYRISFDHDRPYEREFEGLKQFEPLSHARESQVDIFHVGRNDDAGFFYYIMELADAVENPKSECRNPKEARNPNEQTDTAKEKLRASGFGLPSSFDIRRSDFYTPRTLKHDLRTRGALPVTECVQIALSLTRALDHLHSHGLVHRDIKSSNIIFVKGVPKLADIGLVTSVDATRSFVGTDGYIPPEGPGTPQGDLYSLGKVLYECVTGKDRLEFPELPADWRSRPDFDRLLEFNEILTKACDACPSQRYGSAKSMLAELELLRHGDSVKSKRAIEQRLKLGRKIALVTAVLGLVGGSAIFVLRELNWGRQTSSNPDVHVGSAVKSPIPKAQALYQQAGYLLKHSTLKDTLQAVTKLTEAVKLDPQFLDAYYRLFEAYSSDWADQLPPHQNGVIGKRLVADRLRMLGPNSAQYLTANSWLEWDDWRFDKAIADAHRACELNPQFLRAHMNYGWYVLCVRGDVATAPAEFDAAERIDGSDTITQVILGIAYYFERNFPRAIEQYQETQRLESVGNDVHGWLCMAYEAAGQYEKALDEYEAYEKGAKPNTGEITSKYRRYRSTLADKGPRGMWQMMLEDLRRTPSTDHYYDMARLYSRLGDAQEIFPLLDKAYHAHNAWIVFLILDDAWDDYRGDPRFDECLDRLGLSKITPLTEWVQQFD